MKRYTTLIRYSALVKVRMSRRKTCLQPRYVIFLLCYSSLLCYSGSVASGSNIGGSLAEIAWNVIGVISRIRNGSGAKDTGEKESHLVLDDPHFLYKTFYRDDDNGEIFSEEKTERSASDTVSSNFHGNSPLLRVWDILETEYNLRRLRQDASLAVTNGQEAIDASAMAASPADAPSVPVPEVKKMGGANGGECNMADHQDDSSAGTSGNQESSACPSSIQRSRRQVAEDLEPYVPYLGFIFYSFPVFSFTLPFGGQLKLFGYDFI